LIEKYCIQPSKVGTIYIWTCISIKEHGPKRDNRIPNPLGIVTGWERVWAGLR